LLNHSPKGPVPARTAQALNSATSGKIARTLGELAEKSQGQSSSFYKDRLRAKGLLRMPCPKRAIIPLIWGKVEDFIDYESGEIAWSRDLKNDLLRHRKVQFDVDKLRPSLYRPFTAAWLFFGFDAPNKSRRSDRMSPYQSPSTSNA
jgi:predicted helicase